jgi:hypothetical protein
MKFAQSLEDHIVPEWRVQYLDYKQGKKKLKKLGKKSSVRNSLKSTPLLTGRTTRAQSRSDYIAASLHNNPSSDAGRNSKTNGSSQIGTPLYQVLEERDRDRTDGNTEHIDPSSYDDGLSSIDAQKNSISGEDQFTLESENSFALPVPAMDYTEHQVYGGTHQEGSTLRDRVSKPPFTPRGISTVPGADVAPLQAPETHDMTPLLRHSTEPERARRSTLSSVTNRSRRSTINAFNNEPKVTRRGSLFNVFDPVRRSLSLSHKNDNENDTELEDLANDARQKFIEWVNGELEKIESFYREREDACVERFLVLQDQIFQLESKKLESKKRWQMRKRLLKNNSPHLNNANGEGSNGAELNDDEDEEDDDLDEDDEDDDDDDDENVYQEYLRMQVRNGTLNDGVIGVAHRNFQLLSFWTRRKLRIVNKFDMPSLPTFEWLKKDGKIEKQYYEEGYYSDEDYNNEQNGEGIAATTSGVANMSEAHMADFQRKRNKIEKAPTVPYFVARRMIKKAVYELYRSMELLKSYKLMNRMAFRKLIKKYDKTTGDNLLNEYMKRVDSAYFTTSDVLENLMTKVEELYTKYFENGNRKVSVTKLRTSAFERTYYLSGYLGGLFLGLGIPYIIFAFYEGLHKTLNGYFINGKYLLQIWGGFLMMVLMGLLFTINCLVWTKYKVNYKFIFEFNQHDALNFKQYMVIPSAFMFLGGLIAWIGFEDFWPDEFSGYDFPWLFLAVAAFVLLCPIDVFFLNARLWILSTFTRLLLSGFYPVEFKDFFLGDIFCSLTYSISNVSMFFCIYANHWNDCVKCGSGRSRLLGFLQCLPSIWRFLQCFRRYADTGDWFPHLANMGKYTVSTLYYMSLSLYRIETIRNHKVLLIFWATVNSLYSGIWDIVMDWSLFQFDSKHFLLRDEIAFKNVYFYYSAMVIDILLRFQWVFYVLFPRQIQQSAITSFCIAVAEVVRRFIWIFFRMENEHATNVHLFRASRELPLPYKTTIRRTKRAHPSSGLQTGTVEIPADDESNVHADVESNGTDMGKSSGVAFTVARFAKRLSHTMRTAHIKDFQRRKITPSAGSVAEEEEEQEDEEADGGGGGGGGAAVSA